MCVPTPKVSIIAPLRNESANVLALASRIGQAFGSRADEFELILVDDGSTDDTWRRMLEAQAADGRVRPLRLLQHHGQSAALWAGIVASRGELLATLDGDLQNDPADLPRLLTGLADCDLICGVRTRRMDGLVRRLSSGTARWARRLVLGVNFRDAGCNLRAFKRSVLPMLFPFDGLHRFMPILVDGAGGIVKELPVSHAARIAGRSKYGVWNRLGRGLLDLTMVALYRRRQFRQLQVIENTLPASLCQGAEKES